MVWSGQYCKWFSVFLFRWVVVPLKRLDLYVIFVISVYIYSIGIVLQEVMFYFIWYSVYLHLLTFPRYWICIHVYSVVIAHIIIHHLGKDCWKEKENARFSLFLKHFQLSYVFFSIFVENSLLFSVIFEFDYLRH